MPPKRSAAEVKVAESPNNTEEAASPVKKKKGYSVETHAVHVRDTLVNENQELANTGHQFKLMSWNVAGLRALASKNVDMLISLIRKHQPDILCLQETKLQSEEEFRNLIPGYRSYWTCSVVKKGYSGVAFFVKDSIPEKFTSSSALQTAPSESINKGKKQKSLMDSWGSKADKSANNNADNSNANNGNVEGSNVTSTASTTQSNTSILSIRYEFPDKRFSGEGRAITMEFDTFFIVGCYVPNSGQTLDRLDYRVDEWDPYIRGYLNELRSKKPVIFFGDLNVGHLDLDIHNPTAKHIVKQAGLTPRERESMTKLLNEGYKDALRELYPSARGVFTYWSQRTMARPVNKGIRLDYFICSDNLFGQSLESNNTNNANNDNDNNDDESRVVRARVYRDIPTPGVLDSYVVPDETIGCSDHCPVALVLKI